MLVLLTVLLGCLSLSQGNEIAAGKLTVKTPSPTTGKYIVGVETTIAFDLSYTVPSGTVTPTAVKVYFSNADGSTKTTEVTATGTPTGAVSSDGTFSGLTAALTIDATDCAAYTKLSASIVATDDTDPNNNEASVDFGSEADKAGLKVCADVGAGTFTLKTPNPATSGFPLATATASTFDLGRTVIGTGGTVTNVKVYFSDANGSKKSTEVTAGGSNAPSGPVTEAGEWKDLTAASLTLDATNCEDYAKLCASITVTDDDSSNNEVCIEFGKDAAKAGEKPDCKSDSPADCSDPGPAPTNGQKSGTDYTHGSTVTYTCDSGFTLSGEGTLTCDDGKWNHAVPTCTADSSAGIPTVDVFIALMAMITALFQI